MSFKNHLSTGRSDLSNRHLKNAPFSKTDEKQLNSSNHSSLKSLPCGRSSLENSTRGRDKKKLLKDMIQTLDTFVAEKNLNRSDARSKILEAVVGESQHFRAQDLIDKLQILFPNQVGRSTVYRNLPLLVECGLLQEGPPTAKGEVVYELFHEEHHDHIVCLDCRHIFEFHDDSIESRQAQISKKLGFTVMDHRHVIYAKCDRLVKQAHES